MSFDLTPEEYADQLARQGVRVTLEPGRRAGYIAMFVVANGIAALTSLPIEEALPELFKENHDDRLDSDRRTAA